MACCPQKGKIGKFYTVFQERKCKNETDNKAQPPALNNNNNNNYNDNNNKNYNNINSNHNN